MLKKIKLVLLLTGLAMLIISILSLFFINFNFGFIIISGVSCAFILYGLFFDKLIKLKWLNYSILGAFVFFLVMTLFIGIYGQNDNVTFYEDSVIVLGAGIRGERVSRMLSYRLDKAVEYSTKNPNAVIVVSGGQGSQEDITEALAMERYLINKGIAKEKIIKEDKATSTYENLLYSKEILDKMFEKPYTAVVITNDFHIFRAVKLAEILNFNITHYNARIDWHSIPLNYSREVMAIIKMWLIGK